MDPRGSAGEITLRATSQDETTQFLHPEPVQNKPARRARFLQQLAVTMLSCLVVLGVLAVLSSRADHDEGHVHKTMEGAKMDGEDKPRVSCTCGNSVGEAKMMGCRYDTIASCWLPDKCRDDELAEHFNKAGPNGTWVYWADPGGSRQLTLEELSELPDGDNCFWASRRWHLVHCTYTWMKLWRSRETGITMPRHYDTIEHIGHCQEMLLGSNGKNLEDLTTEAAVGLDGDNLSLGPSGGCPKDKALGHEII